MLPSPPPPPAPPPATPHLRRPPAAALRCSTGRWPRSAARRGGWAVASTRPRGATVDTTPLPAPSPVDSPPSAPCHSPPLLVATSPFPFPNPPIPPPPLPTFRTDYGSHGLGWSRRRPASVRPWRAAVILPSVYVPSGCCRHWVVVTGTRQRGHGRFRLCFLRSPPTAPRPSPPLAVRGERGWRDICAQRSLRGGAAGLDKLSVARGWWRTHHPDRRACSPACPTPFSPWTLRHFATRGWERGVRTRGILL